MEFLAVGGIIFWIIFAVFLISLVYNIDRENFGWVIGLTLIFIGYASFVGDNNLLGWIVDNPIKSLIYAGIYLCIGIAWAVGKWYFITRKLANAYSSSRTSYMRSVNITDPSTLQASDLDAIYRSMKQEHGILDSHIDILRRRDDTKERRVKIGIWVFYWPISAFWTLLNDPIKELFHHIYHGFIKGTFEKITKINLGKFDELNK